MHLSVFTRDLHLFDWFAVVCRRSYYSCSCDFRIAIDCMIAHTDSRLCYNVSMDICSCFLGTSAHRLPPALGSVSVLTLELQLHWMLFHSFVPAICRRSFPTSVFEIHRRCICSGGKKHICIYLCLHEICICFDWFAVVCCRPYVLSSCDFRLRLIA